VAWCNGAASWEGPEALYLVDADEGGEDEGDDYEYDDDDDADSDNESWVTDDSAEEQVGAHL
jgi:hypothetical protein